MKISTIKTIVSYLTGGMAGVIEYLLDLFNKQILSKVSAATAKKYSLDVQAVALCLNTILNNHAEDLSEARKEALVGVINAVDELAKALEDAKIEESELDAIVEKIKAAIAAWKAAK